MCWSAATGAIRCSTRGTANAAVSGIIAIQYDARSKPTTHDASVIAQALIKDPNEA